MKIQNKFKLRPIGALVATLFVAGSVQAGDFTMDRAEMPVYAYLFQICYGRFKKVWNN